MLKTISSKSKQHGGAWESQIRTQRSVSAYLLYHQVTQLQTLSAEAEAIVNSRLLTVDHSDNLEPLTPNHLLTNYEIKVPFFPQPGVFQRAFYSMKRWGRVQHLAGSSGTAGRRNVCFRLWPVRRGCGREETCKPAIVIIKDEKRPPNEWRFVRVAEVFVSDDGSVRQVKLVVADTSLYRRRLEPVNYLKRPVLKASFADRKESLPRNNTGITIPAGCNDCWLLFK